MRYLAENEEHKSEISCPWGMNGRDYIEAVIDDGVMKCWQIFSAQK